MRETWWTQVACIGLTGIIAALFRWTVALGPYSGMGKPPMFGDYEAQRHWMEITLNLPSNEWYMETNDNDLQYWGLDYPPLTAYHSYILGKIARVWNSSWVELGSSRGIESYHHKLFMRYTVLIVDVLIYFSAAFLYVLHIQKRAGKILAKCVVIGTHLIYPGLILVDHGHFQYNCVSLGLFLWAVIMIHGNHDILASIFFVCALNYKQMELYHALPFFCYLMGNVLQEKGILYKSKKLAGIGLAVILTFVIIWLPFIWEYNVFAQVLKRLFPVSRGVFEDKVANFWCASSLVIKWKSLLSPEKMVLLCTVSTLTAVFPSSLMLMINPTKHQFKLSLLNCSLAFFIFSFQVHEKSILLASVPALLLIHEETKICGWFLVSTVLSLFHLMVKDNMVLQFFVLSVFFYLWITDVCYLKDFRSWSKPNKAWKIEFHAIFYNSFTLLGFGLCVLSLILKPPKRYPDIFPTINAAYFCAQFIGFLLYFNYKQYLSFTAQYRELKKNKKRKNK